MAFYSGSFLVYKLLLKWIYCDENYFMKSSNGDDNRARLPPIKSAIKSLDSHRLIESTPS